MLGGIHSHFRHSGEEKNSQLPPGIKPWLYYFLRADAKISIYNMIWQSFVTESSSVCLDRQMKMTVALSLAVQGLSLSHSLTHTFSLALSLSHSHTHTHTHTHTQNHPVKTGKRKGKST
jgi:hypothetical protein